MSASESASDQSITEVLDDAFSNNWVFMGEASISKISFFVDVKSIKQAGNRLQFVEMSVNTNNRRQQSAEVGFLKYEVDLASGQYREIEWTDYDQRGELVCHSTDAERWKDPLPGSIAQQEITFARSRVNPSSAF